MNYAHIVQYVMSTPWAVLPSKLTEIMSVLAFRAAGHEFTPEEIEARIGSGRALSGASRSGAVAVIPVHGTIAHRMNMLEASSGGTSTEHVSSMLKAAMDDPNVDTLLLDVDSPGGTITGVQELAAEIRAAREQKYIVAMANSMMASAAYWLAAQADEIVSIPSGVVGSIGVFTAHADMSRSLQQAGIDVTLVSAGKYKTEGSQFKPLSDEARDVLQARIDVAYENFVADVAQGRKVSVEAVKEGYGQGRALDAPDALKAGLIDRIATVDELVGSLVGKRTSAMRADAVSVEVYAHEEADRLRRMERF